MQRSREKTLGEDHIDTISTVSVLAYVFRKRGQYQDPLPLIQKACAGFEKTLGSDHPRTQETAKEYSDFVEDMRRKSEAKSMNVIDEDL